MPLDELDRARAEYLWQLQRHRPTLDGRIKDLAQVFGVLMAAEPPRQAHAPVLQDGSARFVHLVSLATPPADAGHRAVVPDPRQGADDGNGAA